MWLLRSPKCWYCCLYFLIRSTNAVTLSMKLYVLYMCQQLQVLRPPIDCFSVLVWWLAFLAILRDESPMYCGVHASDADRFTTVRSAR